MPVEILISNKKNNDNIPSKKPGKPSSIPIKDSYERNDRSNKTPLRERK